MNSRPIRKPKIKFVGGRPDANNTHARQFLETDSKVELDELAAEHGYELDRRYTEEGMLEFWNEFSEWKKKRTDQSSIENSYFIGVRGVVFYINHWLIASVSSYEAIGAGKDFALAALHLGHTAEEAVATAIELSIYCEAPIQLISKKI